MAEQNGVDAKNLFEAGGKVAEILQPFGKSERDRILRLVIEGLGLSKIPAAEQKPPEQPLLNQPDAGTRSKDIKSFVQEKQPKSDQQFATVVAYYYRFMASEEERKEFITSEDLQTAARQATGAGFSVPSTTLNNTVKQGYLDRGGRGEFRVNAVGENLVAMTLPSDGGATPSRSKKRAKKKSRKKSAKKSTRATKKRRRRGN